MNTPVSLEIDRLLIAKGIDMPVSTTLADVVMWLYEKRGVWISVKERKHTEEQTPFVSYIGSMRVTGRFSIPTEAYEIAVKYCLKNLI